MPNADPRQHDAAVRQAAFGHLDRLVDEDRVLNHRQLAQGFHFQGRRWPLVNPQRGLFKP